MELNSKKFILTGALALGIASIASTGTVLAEEEKPTADASVGIYSKYIWRGFNLEDGMVIQPSLTVGYKGFAANLWGNLNVDQDDTSSNSFNWFETDFTLSYDGAYEKLGYSIGYIYYDVDGDEDSPTGYTTQEIYLGLSYDILLNPSVTVYRDIADIPGYYVNLGIGHSFPITDKYALDLGASAGYYNIDDYSALHDGQLSASITVPVNEYLSVTPEIYYSFPLSNDADDDAGLDNEFYGGLSASFAF